MILPLFKRKSCMSTPIVDIVPADFGKAGGGGGIPYLFE
jgi:hypothetical protein